MSKTKKVKKAAIITTAIGVITTGIWIVDLDDEPYNENISNIEEAEEDYKDKCLTFNTIEEAETEQQRIDLILGYAVEEEIDGQTEIVYPYSTKHTYAIDKHPTKDEWRICYPKVAGMKTKMKNVQFLDEEKLNKMKKKDELPSDWIPNDTIQ